MAGSEYERHRDFITQAQSASAVQRQRRLARLEASRKGIEFSCEMASRLVAERPEIDRPKDSGARTADDIASMFMPHTFIRRPFLWSPSGEAQPPIAQLLRGNEEALRFYLLMVFLSQLPSGFTLEMVASRRTSSARPSWPGLLGHQELSDRQHSARLQRALTRLEDFGLVRLPPSGTRGRYRRPVLLDERRNGREYRSPLAGARRSLDSSLDPLGTWIAPTRRRDLLLIPTDFFINGWWLVLTGPEIATYLMLLDTRFHYNRKPHEYVFVPRSIRLLQFGLSDEIYRSNRELTEFGLLTLNREHLRDRGRARRDSKSLAPMEFIPSRAVLGHRAADKVMSHLRVQRHAPHLSHHGPRVQKRLDATMRRVNGYLRKDILHEVSYSGNLEDLTSIQDVLGWEVLDEVNGKMQRLPWAETPEPSEYPEPREAMLSHDSVPERVYFADPLDPQWDHEPDDPDPPDWATVDHYDDPHPQPSEVWVSSKRLIAERRRNERLRHWPAPNIPKDLSIDLE